MNETATLAQPWPAMQKWLFRFAFIFFLLYVFSGIIPDDYMHKLIVWEAAHVLHLANPITVFSNGSGDTTYDYLVVMLYFFAAILGAAIWSVANRRPSNYNGLYYCLTVVLRFYLATIMIGYGASKIIKLQFPYPDAYRLLEPYGNSSPMGLAWTFMGFSKGYNYFTGSAEVICGLLLFFRKTTTLGAVIALVVATNIMAINYCFDVPVKLMSTLLVIMTLFLLGKDTTRIINFFFLNRDAAPSNITPLRFKTKWKNTTLVTLKYLLIAFFVLTTFYNCIQEAIANDEDARKSSLNGLYNTVTFIRNRDTVPPLITDRLRWRRLIINTNYAYVYMMNDHANAYTFKIDSVTKQATIYKYNNTQDLVLSYTLSKQGALILQGKLLNDSVKIDLQKYDDKKFLLMGRGFHWINEYPLNR